MTFPPAASGNSGSHCKSAASPLSPLANCRHSTLNGQKRFCFRFAKGEKERNCSVKQCPRDKCSAGLRISAADQRKANRCSVGFTGTALTSGPVTTPGSLLLFLSAAPLSSINHTHTHTQWETRWLTSNWWHLSACSEFVSVHWVIIEHGRRSLT